GVQVVAGQQRCAALAEMLARARIPRRQPARHRTFQMREVRHRQGRKAQGVGLRDWGLVPSSGVVASEQRWLVDGRGQRADESLIPTPQSLPRSRLLAEQFRILLLLKVVDVLDELVGDLLNLVESLLLVVL